MRSSIETNIPSHPAKRRKVGSEKDIPTLGRILSRTVKPWEARHWSVATCLTLSGVPGLIGVMRKMIPRDAYEEDKPEFPQTIQPSVIIQEKSDIMTITPLTPLLGMALGVNDEEEEEDEPSQTPSQQQKQIRETITSLDIEKDRSILDQIEIPGPWSVGLVINLADRYNSKGQPLSKRQKVKSLTIVFLTCKGISEFEEALNSITETKVRNVRNDRGRPPPKKRADTIIRVRNRGFLKIVLAITGFPTFRMAKDAFLCWKQHTRGPGSRLNCGIVIWKEFRSVLCEDLSLYCASDPPEVAIPILQDMQ